MAGILLGLAVAVLIIAVVFLLMLSLKQPQVNHVKMDKFSLEGLTYSAGIGRVIDSVLPSTEE